MSTAEFTKCKPRVSGEEFSMKRRRTLIALLLMLALLVSACSQTAPTKQAGEEAAAEAEAEAVSTEEAGGDDYSDLIQPFQSLPEDADVRPQAENRDEVTPTRVATTMFAWRLRARSCTAMSCPP